MLRETFFKPTLNKKLIAMMLSLSLSLITILILLYYKTEEIMYNEFERQTAELTKAIQAGLSGAMGKGVTDESRLQGYLEQLNVKGVKEISVINTTDRIISSTNPEMVGKWVTKSKKELIVKADLGEPVTEQDMIYNIMIPVLVEDRHLGYINLTVTAEDFSAFLHTSLIRRISAASAILFVGLVLAVFLARRYTKPIEEIVAAAKRVAGGELDQSLTMERRDEIGDLARSFNYMLERLREERSIRERLRKTEHLASLGQFSRTIAHEIRNPLNFISLSIDHIRESYRPANGEKSEKFDSLLSNMKDEIHRIGKFASNYLEYGRPLELKRKRVNMNRIVEDVIELAAAKARREGVLIRREFGELPEVYADPELIKTCLNNVIINAFQALNGEGTITVKASAVERELTVTVTDNGPGVPEEVLGKVFDPLFSTKTDGLGMGLSFSKRVVEEHGGRISFQSKPGEGSSVSVSLPIED